MLLFIVHCKGFLAITVTVGVLGVSEMFNQAVVC